MAKYCIFKEYPRYGSRDEIVGTAARKVSCAKTLRLAKKRARAAAEGDNGEVRTVLCKGVRFCRQSIGRKRRKQQRSTRASRRGIPF